MAYTDLRKGRYSEHQRIYLVTTVTRERFPFFNDVGIGRQVVHQLMLLEQEGRTETLCFVVMPDHLHWLVRLQAGALAEAVQRLKGRSARRVGCPLWQANYHDHALRRDEDIQDIARYIVANPLRAGLVARLGDYPLWDAAWL